ncbi:hypothetical protein J6590_100603, partial [Homalodisca vitripennis]
MTPFFYTINVYCPFYIWSDEDNLGRFCTSREARQFSPMSLLAMLFLLDVHYPAAQKIT